MTGKRTPEKGLAKQVVTDLVAPLAGLNHVVYCNNFGSLAETLAEDLIFIVAGTMKALKCKTLGVIYTAHIMPMRVRGSWPRLACCSSTRVVLSVLAPT